MTRPLPVAESFLKKIITSFFILISFNLMGQPAQKNTDWANLEKYAAQNSKLQAPAKGEKRIVFMGDSITEFWEYTSTAFFHGNGYINRGISGQTTAQMLERFRPDVIALKPTVVVILAGINDIAENGGPVSIEDIFRNIVSMAQLARTHNIKVVLSSLLPANRIPWRSIDQTAEKVIRLNEMIKSYCTKNKILYVDYYTIMVDTKKGLLKIYSEDGLHPNLAGYGVMEPLVQDAIKLVLKK